MRLISTLLPFLIAKVFSDGVGNQLPFALSDKKTEENNPVPFLSGYTQDLPFVATPTQINFNDNNLGSITHPDVVVSTDLEPDDFYAILRILLQLKTQPANKIIFLVGEGEQQQKRVEALKDFVEKVAKEKDIELPENIYFYSPSIQSETTDPHIKRYDRIFFGADSHHKTSKAEVDESFSSYIGNITDSLQSGRKVVLLELKPINALPELMDHLQSSGIEGLDKKLIIHTSGSFNIRELIKRKLANNTDINQLINTHFSSLSESYTALGKGEYPELKQYSAEEIDKEKNPLVKKYMETISCIAGAIEKNASGSEVMKIIKESIINWDKAVLEFFITDTISTIQQIVKDFKCDEYSGKELEKKLENKDLDSRQISEGFVESINTALAKNPQKEEVQKALEKSGSYQIISDMKESLIQGTLADLIAVLFAYEKGDLFEQKKFQYEYPASGSFPITHDTKLLQKGVLSPVGIKVPEFLTALDELFADGKCYPANSQEETSQIDVKEAIKSFSIFALCVIAVRSLLELTKDKSINQPSDENPTSHPRSPSSELDIQKDRLL